MGTLVAMVLTAVLSIAHSDASRVVVYNKTGVNLRELTVSACGQSRMFNNVGDGASVGLRLNPNGAAGDISITTNGVVQWRGEYIEPSGSYRIVLRLRRDGKVESFNTFSWWRRLSTRTDLSL